MKKFSPIPRAFAVTVFLLCFSSPAHSCRLFEVETNPFQALGQIAAKGKQSSVSWPKGNEAKFKKNIAEIKTLTQEIKSRFESAKLSRLIQLLSETLDLHSETMDGQPGVANYHHSYKRPIQEAVELLKNLPEIFRIQMPRPLLSALSLKPVPVEVSKKHAEEAYDNGVPTREIVNLGTGLLEELPSENKELPDAIVELGKENIHRMKMLVQFEAFLFTVKLGFPLIDSLKLIATFVQQNPEWKDLVPPQITFEDYLAATQQGIQEIVGTLGVFVNTELRGTYRDTVQRLRGNRLDLAIALVVFGEKNLIPATWRNARVRILGLIRGGIARRNPLDEAFETS